MALLLFERAWKYLCQSGAVVPSWIFVDPVDQISEENLPKFAQTLHITTYAMLRLWLSVEDRLQALHPDFRPSLKTRQVGDTQEIQTTRDVIYAGAATGPSSALHEPIWVNPYLNSTLQPLHPKYNPLFATNNETLITAPRSAGADLITPHAAEQFKADAFFARGGEDTSSERALRHSVVAAELSKNRFGLQYLTLITPQRGFRSSTRE